MIKLELADLNEINLILTALGELPAKMTYHLIQKIESQYKEQQPKPPAEVPPENT